MARFDRGWVKIHRRVVEEDIGLRGNFTLGLFVRLVRMANWKEGSVPLGAQKIILKPGQLASSLRELSPDVDEDPHLNRVRTALRYLEMRGTIAQESSNHGRIITLCNWDEYQREDDDAHSFSTSEPQTDHRRTTDGPQHSEEDKKVRKKEGKGKSAVALPRLAELWNSHRGGLPEVRGCSGTRRKYADSRWKEKPDPQYWTDIIARILRSPFCTGDNDRGWVADFDFLIRPETQHKVLEGKYDARDAGSPKSQLSDAQRADLEQHEREMERFRREMRGEPLDA